MQAPALRAKVSSNVADLEALFQQTGWTPGLACIRPSEAVRRDKQLLLENATRRYVTTKDYVLVWAGRAAPLGLTAPQHRIFRLPCASKGGFANSLLYCEASVEAAARRTPTERAAGKLRTSRFVDNLFPYELPQGTRHSVLWCMLDEDEDENSVQGLSDDFIQCAIEQALRTETGGDAFSFVWYRNPKPSIVDGITYHVQVFWRTEEH